MESVERIGTDVLVNETTAGTQSDPAAVTLANGTVVLAWTDGGGSIKGRLLDANGVPHGHDLAISATGATSQSNVSLAALATGGFIATWSDGPNSTVRGRIFGSDASPVGSTFVIPDHAAVFQGNSKISTLSNGNVVVTWSEYNGSSNAIHAQILSASGTRVGSDLTVAAGGDVSDPDIVALSGGGFAIAWSTGSASLGSNIHAQIFTAAGATVGAEMAVTSDTVGWHRDPVLGALPANGFIVAWKVATHAGFADNLYFVDAQVFADGGTAVGNRIPVNTNPTAFDPQGLEVQTLSDGRFLVMWPDFSGATGDNDQSSIVAQLFDDVGQRSGVETRLNDQTVHGQFDGATTLLSNGQVLAAWTDQGVNRGVDIAARLLAIAPPTPFNSTANIVDFNTANLSGFAGPFNNALGGNDVVTLPDSAALVASLGISGGFLGGDGDDALTEGATFVPLYGGNGNDLLTGGAGRDALSGDAGDDTLVGGGGTNELAGGDGNDNYIVTNAADTLIEQLGAGIDTVSTILSAYALPANIENLTYTGSVAFSGVGNALDNVITGSMIASELVGLGGNDTYVVYAIGTTIVERPGDGIDTIATSLPDFSLAGYANAENLTFIGTGRFNGTGNALDNLITGGTIAGELVGLGGNDTYVVRNTGDTIVETPGGGTDTIQTALSTFSLAGYANVENLTYSGTGSFTGVGNALDNAITGGAKGDDYLFAGAGIDTLTGGAGGDVFLFNEAVNGIDRLTDFVSGSDRIFMNSAVFSHTAFFALVQGSGAQFATAASSTFLYDSSTGALSYDADGTGAGAAIQFATLSTGLTLAAGDFVFY